MQKSSTTDDERAIRELVDTWMSATMAGDTQAVLDLMTNDVVFMVPGQEPFGKETFENALKDTPNIQYEGNSEIKELKILGDWAYMRTYLKVTTHSPEGNSPLIRSGYALTILRKEPDGQWRLARDANLLSADRK